MSVYLSQKEEVLLARIAKAKQQLEQLYQKKKIELGELAFQYGLHHLNAESLTNEFRKISETHRGDQNV